MRIEKAIFPAAGLGTRFLPATKAQPKEMLPLVDKPIIQYVVEEAVASKIREIIMVTGRGKRAIEDHFDVSFELEHILREKEKFDLLKQIQDISDLVKISYIRQKEALGLGHAILVIQHLVGNEPFAVALGDDIIDAEVPCLKQLIDVYNKYKCSVIAIQKVKKEEIHQYGIIKAKEVEKGVHQIYDLVEKPTVSEAPSNLAIIGRYILTPEIFEALAKTEPDTGGEIQLTNGLRHLLIQQPIYAYEFKGVRYDAGDKLGFLKATVEFALKREDLGQEFRDYLIQLLIKK